MHHPDDSYLAAYLLLYNWLKNLHWKKFVSRGNYLDCKQLTEHVIIWETKKKKKIAFGRKKKHPPPGTTVHLSGVSQATQAHFTSVSWSCLESCSALTTRSNCEFADLTVWLGMKKTTLLAWGGNRYTALLDPSHRVGGREGEQSWALTKRNFYSLHTTTGEANVRVFPSCDTVLHKSFILNMEIWSRWFLKQYLIYLHSSVFTMTFSE